MPIRFTQGEIARLLRQFNMRPAARGSRTYYGVGRDGILRRCYFHYHSDATPVAAGTAKAIAAQLGFADLEAMKAAIDGRAHENRV
ncbi:MAG: hypothetical protein ACM3X6_01250 [Patescibacteria group bacterium]